MLSGTFGTADANVLGYRSDVYSLGCILFKMCFGVTPYQHIEKMQVIYIRINLVIFRRLEVMLLC